jgi:hypothetical protein
LSTTCAKACRDAAGKDRTHGRPGTVFQPKTTSFRQTRNQLGVIVDSDQYRRRGEFGGLIPANRDLPRRLESLSSHVLKHPGNRIRGSVRRSVVQDKFLEPSMLLLGNRRVDGAKHFFARLRVTMQIVAAGAH